MGPQLCDGALPCLQDRVSIRLSDLSLELALPEPGRIDTQERKGVLQLPEDILHQGNEISLRQPQSFVVGEPCQMSSQEGLCLCFAMKTTGLGHE